MINARLELWMKMLSLSMASIATTACCSARVLSHEEAVHFVVADEDGGFCVPYGASSPGSHAAHAKNIAKAYQESGCSRVMLIVHGGLVARDEGIRDSLKTLAAMSPEFRRETFPIFVVWETGILRSYVDNLFSVRAGRNNPMVAVPTVPVVFLAELGRAIARYPLTLGRQLVAGFSYYVNQSVAGVPEGWRDQAYIDTRTGDCGACTTICEIGGELIPGVVRLITTPMLDMVGLPAFKNMRRRARVLFVRDRDHDTSQLSGAMPVLMMELAMAKELPKFMIVAHSMGALVANEIIQRYGHPQWPEDLRLQPVKVPGFGTIMVPVIKFSADRLDFSHIVYMGAACSVREFAGAVLPYLRTNDTSRFYNLCLHPSDEQNDRYLGGTMPHGSLLEWIDNFITEQESPLDRTLGKWNNAMENLVMMDIVAPAVRERIRIRGFPRGGPGPHDHGQFNDFNQTFWESDFWWQPPPKTGR